MSDKDTFVSRLARAMWLHKAPAAELGEWHWEEIPNGERIYWTSIALAALEGLREPTPEMCLAGGKQSAEIWRRMVDAAYADTEYDPEELDPTRPLPPLQIEDAYRRGFQQSAHFLFNAVERHLPEVRRDELKKWLGESLFKWRYNLKAKRTQQRPPLPPHGA